MASAVIVGAGECGTLAALTLRSSGWEGDITLIGAEPVLPYERPPLSKVAMTEAEHSGHVGLATEATFEAAQISYFSGTAVEALNRDARRVELADDRHVPYDRVLLATGASPRPLPMAAGLDGVHYLRTHADALVLRDQLTPGARVCVIGGGFIGLELAASARSRGCVVTVLELGPRLMGRVVPPEIASIVERRHRDAGVDIRCGVAIESITSAERRIQVTMAGDGDVVHCEVLVVGVGATPETGLAEKAGLEIDNGIRVDGYLMTSDAQIFAAGDCASFPHPLFGGSRMRLESWRNARDQAVTAVHNMMNPSEQYVSIPWFWTDQYELSLQIAGLPTMATTEAVRVREDGVQVRFGLDSDGFLKSASAIGVGNVVAKDIRLAEMMMSRGARPSPEALTDPRVSLKSLLRG
jgi:3-phenylpropionate/trans-cinnamate dioxygenase ferredoxin reductase subunit